MQASLWQLAGLLLTLGGMVWILSFVVAGSRPQRQGRPTHARRWSYLQRYYATGLAARVAAGLPFGWAVGEIAATLEWRPVLAAGAAFVLAWLAWTIAPAVEGAVGAAALAIQILWLVTRGDDVGLLATFFFAGALASAAVAAGVLGLQVGAIPLALAAALELAVLMVEMGGADAITQGPQFVINGLLIVGAVVLIVSAPRLVLAMLGVALVFGNLAALLLLGPDSRPALLCGFASMAAVAPVALFARPGRAAAF